MINCGDARTGIFDTDSNVNREQIQQHCSKVWSDSITPELMQYIGIPNKSPAFDPDWEGNGHMERAVQQFCGWIAARPLRGMRHEVIRLPGRTPLILIKVDGQSDQTVLLYGHLDKQPEMSGWRDGLGPWQAVLDGEKLYGRGAADDGYAMFASLLAIESLQQQGIPHGRCVVIIEACEESGSPDLPGYVDHMESQLGTPDLVICLDSGCGNYEQLWCTTSLRGLIGGELRIEVLGEGIHSGDAGGVVPCSFRILRQLLDRIEDSDCGEIMGDFHVDIPDQRLQQARAAAAMLGDAIHTRFPLSGNTRPVNPDPYELILNRSWRPALSVIGADGLPPIQSAGNVLRPMTAVKLSLRLPPTCDAESASKTLAEILTRDPPHGARVSYTPDWAASGWMAPDMAPWLGEAIDAASQACFGKPAVYMGEGWSIPFMGMLGEKFPSAQFLITGVLGPGSNAHGPNEFLHLPTAEKLTACMAQVIAGHFEQFS